MKATCPSCPTWRHQALHFAPTNIHQSLVSSWRSDDALLSCTDAMMASSCLACTLSSRRDLKRPQQSDQNFLKWQFRVRNLQRTARPPFQSIWPGSEVWCRQLRSQDEISQNYNSQKTNRSPPDEMEGNWVPNLIKVQSNSTLWTPALSILWIWRGCFSFRLILVCSSGRHSQVGKKGYVTNLHFIT